MVDLKLNFCSGHMHFLNFRLASALDSKASFTTKNTGLYINVLWRGW